MQGLPLCNKCCACQQLAAAQFCSQHLADRVQCCLQELWTFWRKVQRMYKTHDLLWPGDDPNFPMGFFSKVWAGRGREYRHLVEPLDIANWCAKPSCYPLSMPACPLLPGKPSLQISKCAPGQRHVSKCAPGQRHGPIVFLLSGCLGQNQAEHALGVQVLQEQAGGVRALCGL